MVLKQHFQVTLSFMFYYHFIVLILVSCWSLNFECYSPSPPWLVFLNTIILHTFSQLGQEQFLLSAKPWGRSFPHYFAYFVLKNLILMQVKQICQLSQAGLLSVLGIRRSGIGFACALDLINQLRTASIHTERFIVMYILFLYCCLSIFDPF